MLVDDTQMATPVVQDMQVIPVAGHDSMLLNLCGAHAPFFTRNLVLLRATTETLTALNRAAIPALPFKGVLLARELYGNIAFRESVDVDVFILPEAAVAAHSALLEAGLRIEFVHEHREVPWQALPWMEPVGPGTTGADGRYQSNRMWRLPETQRDLVPLMYSLLATKPGR